VFVIECKHTSIYGLDETARRRRLQCEKCGQRSTTKEISKDLLDHLVGCHRNLEKIKALTLAQSANHTSLPKSLWSNCIFNECNSCSLELPEFKTKESADCSMHQSTSTSSCKQKPQRKLLMPQGFSQRHATTVASAFSKGNQDKYLAPPSTWSIEGLSMSSSHDSSLPRELWHDDRCGQIQSPKSHPTRWPAWVNPIRTRFLSCQSPPNQDFLCR
jgi:hypothetical protein